MRPSRNKILVASVRSGSALVLVECVISFSLSAFCAALPAAKTANSPTATCDDEKLVCIFEPAPGSVVSNPLLLVAEAQSEDIEIAWRLKDSTGNILESASTLDYLEAFSGKTASSRSLHLKDYGLLPAATGRGTLTVTPIRTGTKDGITLLPEIVLL